MKTSVRIFLWTQHQDTRTQQPCNSLWIQTNFEGVFWRGLYPLLMDAPSSVRQRAIRILQRHSRCIPVPSGSSTSNNDIDINTNEKTNRPMDLQQQRKNPSKKSLDFWLVPPQITRLQYTFSGLLIRYEHLWLTLQSLSAYIATLGGGYFLCRHLSTAVRMARHQRALALWMCDFTTADRCTLNEAFNYIHAGQFRVASRMIREVRDSSMRRRDALTLRMVGSARLFLHQVKMAAKFARHKKDDTVDDFQRVRIVPDRSQDVLLL